MLGFIWTTNNMSPGNALYIELGNSANTSGPGFNSYLVGLVVRCVKD